MEYSNIFEPKEYKYIFSIELDYNKINFDLDLDNNIINYEIIIKNIKD